MCKNEVYIVADGSESILAIQGKRSGSIQRMERKFDTSDENEVK
jgi:hypothetical protein